MNKTSQTQVPALRISRLLPATPEEVFGAWTDPDSVKLWMAPGALTVPIAELDVRVGGRFRIVMRGEGGDYVHEGEYREVSPPHRLVFTWISKGTHGKETVVTVELEARGEGTELTLTHEGLPDPEQRAQHEGGWSGILDKFASQME